jgi:phosphate transport system permease protein
LIFISASETLKSVPNDLREASLALGISKWGTIRNIVIPSSINGMTSGVIIAIGRAIGETAAVLFTAGYALFISESILEPTASLPNMIYRYADRASTFPGIRDKLYAVALTLIIIVLVLNIVARAINHYSTRKLSN